MSENDNPLEVLRKFIQFDTTNPPGNEEEAVLFLEDILRRNGIGARVLSPTAKRANLCATISGKTPGRPVILLGHVDVVPAREEEWQFDPFGGEVKDGYLYGRGAIDMKSQVICHLFAFIDLARKGIVPEQDIVFLATSDEEVGGEYGVKSVLEEMPELGRASFVWSEGGSLVDDGGFVHAQVSVTEKKLGQFIIKAKGTGGHGSMPHKDNPNEKVIRAAHALMSKPFPFKASSTVSAYLNGLIKGGQMPGFRHRNLSEALKDDKFRKFIENNQVYNALLRNTVTPTILRGGEKINVIPAESCAYFDARLLPAESTERFNATIRRICGKEIEMVPVREVTDQPAPSGYNTPFFRGMKKVVREMYGSIPVLPFMTTGATDLRYFRERGIPSYGFFPILLPNEELFRMHGKDERISIENFQRGLEGTREVLEFLAIYK